MVPTWSSFQPLLQFYGSIVIVVLAEVTCAVLAFVFKDSVHKVITGALEEGMILRYQDDEDALMDWFQENVCHLVTLYLIKVVVLFFEVLSFAYV